MIELAPKSNGLVTYDEAILYCHFCSYNGHIDWRMPTVADWFINDDVVGWYVNRLYAEGNDLIVPVRDI